MSTRILSKEESEALSFGAVELIYKCLNDGYCTPEVIEKTLLHAVVVSRLNQCLVDAGTLSLLMEKISEYEGISLLGPERDGEGNAGRYC